MSGFYYEVLKTIDDKIDNALSSPANLQWPAHHQPVPVSDRPVSDQMRSRQYSHMQSSSQFTTTAPYHAREPQPQYSVRSTMSESSYTRDRYGHTRTTTDTYGRIRNTTAST